MKRAGPTSRMQTGRGDFFDVDARFHGDGAQDAERCNAGDDGREEVEEGNDEGINVDPIAEFIVRTEQDQSAPRDAQRVKHLLGRFTPHLFINLFTIRIFH